MGDLLHIEQLRVFLFFVAPGIVALFVRAQFLLGKMPPIAEGVVAYITISLIYHALVYPIAWHLYASSETLSWFVLDWIALIIIGPALLGFVLGLNIKMGWTRTALSKVGINTIHPVDSAWDWKFAGCGECFVLVVLKDDTKWAGFISKNSFMSSQPSERDIFIEQVYDHSDTSPWTPRVSGVWIAHGEIRSIEFWPNS